MVCQNRVCYKSIHFFFAVGTMPKKTKIILSESSVGRRMRKFQTKEVAESDDDEVFDKCLFRRRFPANREDYLRDNWIFIKNHLAKHDLQVKVKFKKRMIAMNVVPKTKNVMLILKGRYLLKLMTFNIPYQYCYRILRSDMHVAFIKAGSMFKNQDIYYKRRHRLLEPDIRTLTYTELFTNCNVLLDQKMIILLGTEKGVKRVCILLIFFCESNLPDSIGK